MLRRFALLALNPTVGFLADRSLRLALLIVGFLPLLFFFFPQAKLEVGKEAK